MKSLVRSRSKVSTTVQPWLGPTIQRRFLRKLHPRDGRAKYDKKVQLADTAWEGKARSIRDGKQQSMLSILEQRGFINQIAGERDELDKIMTEERIGAYVGIDPTAPSLHLGNLLPVMVLLWLYIHGFETVTIVGGATALIGDPTGRTNSRNPIDNKSRRANVASMQVQVKRLWQKMEKHADRHGYVRDWSWRRSIFNNNEWLQNVSIYEFMRLVGMGTRVGPLLSRDTVKTKMEKGDGVSFGEFSYPLLQAWDWWHLLQRRGISMQIGGSDQFGNIITGIETMSMLQKRTKDEVLHEEYRWRKPVALTVPLLTTSAGEKFGKSAGNAIWLDEDMTPPLELYQFLLRSADADVERYLKLFTLLPLDEITKLMSEHSSNPSLRIPQRKLANEMVSMIHGQGECERVEGELSTLYGSHATTASAAGLQSQPLSNLRKTPTTSENAGGTRAFLPMSAIASRPFSHVLHAAGLAPSRSAANKLLVNGGAYVGSQPGAQVGGMGDSLKFAPLAPFEAARTEKYLIDGNLLILRVGKWKVKIIEVLEDEEYERRGLPAPPGQEGVGATNVTNLFSEKERTGGDKHSGDFPRR